MVHVWRISEHWELPEQYLATRMCMLLERCGRLRCILGGVFRACGGRFRGFLAV